MIVLGVLSVVWGLFSLLFSPFPTGSLGLNALAASVVSDGFFSHLAWINSYLPVDPAVAAFSILLGLVSVVLTFRLVMWVLRVLHIVGGD